MTRGARTDDDSRRISEVPACCAAGSRIGYRLSVRVICVSRDPQKVCVKFGCVRTSTVYTLRCYVPLGCPVDPVNFQAQGPPPGALFFGPLRRPPHPVRSNASYHAPTDERPVGRKMMICSIKVVRSHSLGEIWKSALHKSMSAKASGAGKGEKRMDNVNDGAKQ